MANDVRRYEKNGLILDAVNSGQVELGLINHYYWYEKEAEIGEGNMRARIAFTELGDPGSLVNVAGAGILTSAADDPAAGRLTPGSGMAFSTNGTVTRKLVWRTGTPALS